MQRTPQLAGGPGAEPVRRMRVARSIGERVMPPVDGHPAEHVALEAHGPGDSQRDPQRRTGGKTPMRQAAVETYRHPEPGKPGRRKPRGPGQSARRRGPTTARSRPRAQRTDRPRSRAATVSCAMRPAGVPAGALISGKTPLPSYGWRPQVPSSLRLASRNCSKAISRTGVWSRPDRELVHAARAGARGQYTQAASLAARDHSPHRHAAAGQAGPPGRGQDEPPNGTAVLRFADAAAAWGLLNDPGYRPVKEIRFSITSRGQAVVAPEFSFGRQWEFGCCHRRHPPAEIGRCQKDGVLSRC